MMGTWPKDSLERDAYEDGYVDGASAAFGLIGMFEAIRTNHARGTWPCDDCGHVNPSCAAWCVACSPEKRALHAERVERETKRKTARRGR